jgi:methylglutaconyl-CoA hydratase
MTEQLILIDRPKPQTTILTLNRPEKRNALNLPLMEQLCLRLDELSKSEACRAVILRGAGPVFCSGLDLKEGLDTTLAERSGAMVARTFRTLSESPKVIIAAAHGAAIAGGGGLLLACDLVVAGDDLLVGFPEVRRGLVAGLVMAYLRRRVREIEANELLLGGELVDAPRAREMGLVNRIVSNDRLMAEAHRLAAAVSEGAPQALRTTKEFLRSLWPHSLEADLEQALGIHGRVRLGEEAQEGMRSFLEKRKPSWR